MHAMPRLGGHLLLIAAFFAQCSAFSPTSFLATPGVHRLSPFFSGSKILCSSRRGIRGCQFGGVHSLRLQANPQGDDKKNPLAPKDPRAQDQGEQAAPKLELDQEAYEFGFRFAEAVDDFQDRYQGAFQANFRQGIPVGSLLSLGFFALLLTGQLNWLFGVVNFLLLSALVVPVAIVVGINLFIKTSIVDGDCPTCGSKVMLPKQKASQCMNCGTPLIIEKGVISRASQYNTQTDVQTGQQSAADVLDVEVKAVDAEVVDPKDYK